MPIRLLSASYPGPPGAAIDETELIAATRAAFISLKRAWAEANADLCRRELTAELWMANKTGIDTMRIDGNISRSAALMITAARVTESAGDGLLQTAKVRLAASGVECIVDKSGRVVSGSPERADWIEVWSMQRSRDPQLLAARAAARCPNCGAPLSVNDEGKCTFCAAPVPGSPTDWLATAIERPPLDTFTWAQEAQATDAAHRVVMDALALQASQTVYAPAPPPTAPEAGPGVAAIEARDPQFNPADFLVEVRQVFLTIEQARTDLSPEPLRALLADDLWRGEKARIEADRAAGSHHLHAMLDIDQVQVVAATADPARDILTARVYARSADHLVNSRGQEIGGENNITAWHLDITFQRSAGLHTNPLAGLNVSACGHCGAPFDVDDAGSCRACGVHVTGGEYDWVVTAIGAAMPGPSSS